MTDKRFRAILAKNHIARELADYQQSKLVSLPYILSCLEDIEKYIGEGNQPSVKDIYENNKDFNNIKI